MYMFDDIFNENEKGIDFLIDRKYAEKEIDLEEDFNSKEISKKSSYKIERNEPCPCGSGKKYKKCCARVNPTMSKEYYLDKISDYMDSDYGEALNQINENFYQLVKEADQDYPVEPLFSNLAGYAAAALDKPRESLAYLLKYHRIVKDDISYVEAFLISNLLIELEKFQKAEEKIEEFLTNKDTPILYMKLAEVKLMLNKNEEGIKYLEKGYKKSNKNINLLNSMVGILKEYRNYKKAYELLSDEFYRFNLLDIDESENQAELAKEMVDDLYSIKERISTKKYKEYLKEVVKVFEIIDIDQNLTQEQINKLNELIEEEVDLGYYLERLCFYNNEYNFVSTNDQVILNITEKADLIIDSIIKTNYMSKDYHKLIKNFKNEFTKEVINSINLDYFIEHLSFYLDSIYELNDKKEMKEVINFLDSALDKDVLDLIRESLTKLDVPREIAILQFIKDINKENNLVNNQKIIDVQLTLFLDTVMEDGKPRVNEERQENIEKYLKEFQNYNTDTFAYHYAKWFLSKAKEEEPDKDIEEIVEYPAGSAESRYIKYLAIIRFVDPNIILNNPPEKDKLISNEDFPFFEMLAKFKNGDLNDINKAEEIYSESFDMVIRSLITIMEQEEIIDIVKNSIRMDTLHKFSNTD